MVEAGKAGPHGWRSAGDSKQMGKDGWSPAAACHPIASHPTFKLLPAQASESSRPAGLGALGFGAGMAPSRLSRAADAAWTGLLLWCAPQPRRLGRPTAHCRLQLAPRARAYFGTLAGNGGCRCMSARRMDRCLCCRRRSTAAGLLCRVTGFRDALCLHRCVVYFVHDPRILVRLGRA